MNQRYDFLAISLLLFTVVLTVCLSMMPISLDAISRWQPLIGGLITGFGILVASWNVTRQMRLAARGRE
jgi:NO-binding membrane sensor protein with MHYT domain